MYNHPRIIIVCCLVLVLSIHAKLADSDEYVNDVETQCHNGSGFMSCGKYKLLKYITYLVEPMDNGRIKSIRFVKLAKENNAVDNATEEFIPTSRYLSVDSEFSKFKKFLLRKISDFTKYQGLVVELPDDVQVLNDGSAIVEGRARKKKLELLLSLVTLFKAFKIKVLLSVALVAIVFIKKTLLLGALYLPSIIHSIKASCREHHFVHDDHDLQDGFGKEYEPYYHH